MAAEVLVRHAVASDLERVIRQWLSSWRDSKWAGVVPNNLFRKVYAETIRQLINRGARIDVACSSENPDILLGFICSEHTQRDRILHYVFVRSTYRQHGVARLLMNTAGFPKGTPFVYTFRTQDMSYLKGGYHVPALARRKDASKPEESSSSQQPPPSIN